MGVRLRVSDFDLLDDLLVFLERRGCPARQLDVDLIEVEVPHAIHAEQARMELALYLYVWKKLSGASIFEIETQDGHTKSSSASKKVQYLMLPARVRITELPQPNELLGAFTRAGYLAVQARQDVIEIHRTPSSGDPPADLDAFLGIWNALHPDAPADLF